MNTLHVVTVRTADRTRVWMVGDIDWTNAGVVEKALTAALAHGIGPVDVDLADVSFLDCAGLRELTEADCGAGGRMRLVAASEAVCRILVLFGMQRHFGTAICN